MTSALGALSGFRVIEFAGLGPCPIAGMLLADMGAEVIVIDRPINAPVAGESSTRPDGSRSDAPAPMHRNKQSVALNLKLAADVDVAWRLIESADAVIEGFRPGVMERLGFSPAAVSARNAKCVFGRVTGWGQSGPLAHAAGHDINYAALAGVLSIASRPHEAPMVPATVVADMGGGAMFLAFGVVCALLEAQRSGRGQVVDAAMVDGIATLTTLVQQMRAATHARANTSLPTASDMAHPIGPWPDDAAQNFFRGASPFYDVFTCACGQFVSLGAIEPAFYAELLQRLGLHDVNPAAQMDTRQWPALRARVAGVIASRTQAQWVQALEGSDVCFAPVLSFEASAVHPHMQARGTWVLVNGQMQPAVAPRLSRTPGRPPSAGVRRGEHSAAVLQSLRQPSAPKS
jgi:alpha-methylacyl-CoA racemase